MQTFAGNCMSHWGWHSFPPPYGWTPEQVPATGTFQKGRNTGGDHFPPETEAIRAWMFDNPHIMNLGRLRLMRPNERILASDELTGLKRTLDLWTGVQTSRYTLDGRDVTVETCVHSSLDLVAVHIESALLADGDLEVALDFGYPTLTNAAWIGDFARTTLGHTTEARRINGRRLDLRRDVDAVAYHVSLEAAAGCSVREPHIPPGYRKLALLHADYGTADTRTDVTKRIRAAVKDSRLTLVVNDSSLGASPAADASKSLRVTYTVDGYSPDGQRAEQTVEVTENRTLMLPPFLGAYTISSSGARSLSFACAFSTDPLPFSLPKFAKTKSSCRLRLAVFLEVRRSDRSFRQQGRSLERAGTTCRSLAIPDGGAVGGQLVFLRNGIAGY